MKEGTIKTIAIAGSMLALMATGALADLLPKIFAAIGVETGSLSSKLQAAGGDGV
jgi:hypothetical protein